MTAPTTVPGSLSMLELVTGMLTREHPRATEFAAEVQRRWEASRAQLRTDDVWNEDLDEWLHSASPDQLAPVEQARQYLAALTLIYELWVLQEVDVPSRHRRTPPIRSPAAFDPNSKPSNATRRLASYPATEAP